MESHNFHILPVIFHSTDQVDIKKQRMNERISAYNLKYQRTIENEENDNKKVNIENRTFYSLLTA